MVIGFYFFGLQALVKSLDFIIDTASGKHPLDPYISILKTTGVLVVVCAPSELKFNPLGLLTGKDSFFSF
jgi:cinnamyl-alcohol dehydrogenase